MLKLKNENYTKKSLITLNQKFEEIKSKKSLYEYNFIVNKIKNVKSRGRFFKLLEINNQNYLIQDSAAYQRDIYKLFFIFNNNFIYNQKLDRKFLYKFNLILLKKKSYVKGRLIKHKIFKNKVYIYCLGLFIPLHIKILNEWYKKEKLDRRFKTKSKIKKINLLLKNYNLKSFLFILNKNKKQLKNNKYPYKISRTDYVKKFLFLNNKNQEINNKDDFKYINC